MRSLISQAITFLVAASTTARGAKDTQHKMNTLEDVLSEPSDGLVKTGAAAGSINSEALSGSPTIFNGIEVPPMKELTGEGFDKETKDGYWYFGLFYKI